MGCGLRQSRHYYSAAAVLLLLCLQQRFDNQNQQVVGLFVGVTAIPLILVESSKASCYDIDATRDTVIKIYYNAPRTCDKFFVMIDTIV